MNTNQKTNNEQLRELVEASGLTQVVALTVFNRGLGVRSYSQSAFKAFLASPQSVRYRPLSDDLLAHAAREFSKVKKKA